MTNEEAINYLHECSEAIGDTEHHTLSYAKEALNMAIKALSQQTEDAISRQAVIDTIENWLSCDDYNEAERHIMRATESVLYDLPSVNLQEPKTEWIPVRERLPESLMVKTLVSCEDADGLPISTIVAHYDAFSKTWDCEYKVIAWMPLPEPYKEREVSDETDN